MFTGLVLNGCKMRKIKISSMCTCGATMTHFKHFLESADINTFSAGIDFRHKNLTFTKDDPRTVTVNKNYNGRWTHNIGIQMERKELTKTFMMNSN